MLLELCNLSKAYRANEQRMQALSGVSLSISAGEKVGLIGESGSGKSSLARIAARLEAPDEGEVRFDGAIVAGRCPKGLQMVFQHPRASFSDRMRVGEGIAEGIAYEDRRLARSERLRLVDQALEQVGLPRSYARKHAWELSGGEAQRAAIARAVIARPKLLVCDEPTSALDVTIQARIMRLLDELCEAFGMACLFISHDLPLVDGFCQRAYVLERGRVVESGLTEDLFSRPQSLALKRLLEATPSL